MALRKFSESTEVVDFNSLPWANQYAKEKSNFAEPVLIKVVSESANGVMVVTREYKALVRDNQPEGAELLEAAKVFFEEKGIYPVLYAQIKRDKRNIEILIDDDDKAARWYRTEERFVQVLNREETPTKQKKKGNRFLAGREVLTTTGAGSMEPTSLSEPETASTVPTKGRKA